MNLLIKPASGRCNLRCGYCFYADEMASRTCPDFGKMSLATLEGIIARLFAQNREEAVSILFQGGEPMLVGLDFYRAAVQWIRHYNTKKIPVHLALQTNGTLVDEAWARFFAEEGFLIGVSLDGTKEIHNFYRKDPLGKDTHNRVLRGISYLKKHGVEFNILSVITDRSVRNLTAFQGFFQKNGFSWLQFIPCLPSLDGKTVPLTAEGYGDFLCRSFDLWYEKILRGEYVSERTFENYVAILMGRPPEDCALRGTCSIQFVIEADGSVYPCDFYALDAYRMGNFLTDSVVDLEKKAEELRFVARSRERCETCTSCPWFSLCRGGCRRSCEPAGDGPLPPSVFCEAYRKFFPYAYDRLLFLAQRLFR